MKTLPKTKVESAINHLELAKKEIDTAIRMIDQDQSANRYPEIAELSRYLQMISQIIESDNNQCGLKQLLK